MHSTKPNYLTSERMMLTVNAALAFHSALELATKIIDEQHKLAKDIHKESFANPNGDKLFEIIENLHLLLNPQVLVDQTGVMPYHQAWFQVITEARHFHDFKSINRRARQYQQHKRRKQSAERAQIPDQTIAATVKSAFEQTQEASRANIQQVYEKLFNQAIEKAEHSQKIEPSNRWMEDAILRQEFSSKYRSITTTAPTEQEIEKFISDPQSYQWPTAPQPTKQQTERDFFRNYQPEE